MHPTTPLCRAVWLALFLAVPLCGMAPAARAQDVKPVAVVGHLIVPIDGTQRLQMTKKQVIAKAINRNEAVLRISPVYGDPSTVLITGLTPGVAIVTLVDEMNREENFEILVQRDVEYLKTILKRAVPTSNIDPIPGANNSIILRGTVARAEDIQVVLDIAENISPRQVTVGPSGPGGLIPTTIPVGPPRIINALRVDGVQQVQLCVVLAQVSRSEFRALAFNFLESTRDVFFGSTVGQAVVNPQTIGLGGILAANGVAVGSPGSPNGQPINAFFGVMSHGNTFLGFLQALRTEQVTKLLAEPRLVTVSGQAATFLSGGQQAIPVPAGLGQVGIQFQPFGTTLNFLPIVLGDGRIHLTVEPEVSSLNAAFGTTIQGTTVPGQTVQRVHTTVDMEPGQTLVIGGLIQHDVTGNTAKVPVLGDIPYLGAAFRSVSYTEDESELIVLVTPHLVDGMSCDQLPRLLPGQETRTPDDCELFLEGILEAPRGQRQAWQGTHYSAPYKSGPSASQFPCAGGNGACGHGACGCQSAAGPVDGAMSALPTPPVESHAMNPPAEMTVPVGAVEMPKGPPPTPVTLPPLK